MFVSRSSLQLIPINNIKTDSRNGGKIVMMAVYNLKGKALFMVPSLPREIDPVN